MFTIINRAKHHYTFVLLVTAIASGMKIFLLVSICGLVIIVIGTNHFKNYSSVPQCVAIFVIYCTYDTIENMFAMLILHALILHSGDNIEILPNPNDIINSVA